MFLLCSQYIFISKIGFGEVYQCHPAQWHGPCHGSNLALSKDKFADIYVVVVNKQARKLQATLVRNYESLTESLTDGCEV